MASNDPLLKQKGSGYHHFTQPRMHVHAFSFRFDAHSFLTGRLRPSHKLAKGTQLYIPDPAATKQELATVSGCNDDTVREPSLSAKQDGAALPAPASHKKTRKRKWQKAAGTEEKRKKRIKVSHKPTTFLTFAVA